MKKKFKILGLIPARAGSKGLKNKNILKINGKPLIEYTINAAKNSKLISEIYVTSDCKKVNKISKKNNLNFIKRPKNLAGDGTQIFDVIIHSINYLFKINKKFDYVVLLQPTTPLKTSSHIDIGIKKIILDKSDSLTSVYKVDDNHPARMYKIIKKKLIPLFDKAQALNRQKLENIYHRDGNIYIFKIKSLFKYGNLYGKKRTPLILNSKYKLNIDNKLDFKLAKTIMEK